MGDCSLWTLHGYPGQFLKGYGSLPFLLHCRPQWWEVCSSIPFFWGFFPISVGCGVGRSLQYTSRPCCHKIKHGGLYNPNVGYRDVPIKPSGTEEARWWDRLSINFKKMLKHELTSPQNLRTQRTLFPESPFVWIACFWWRLDLCCLASFSHSLLSSLYPYESEMWLPQPLPSPYKGGVRQSSESDRGTPGTTSTANSWTHTIIPVTNSPPAPISWNLFSSLKHTDNHHGAGGSFKKNPEHL